MGTDSWLFLFFRLVSLFLVHRVAAIYFQLVVSLSRNEAARQDGELFIKNTVNISATHNRNYTVKEIAISITLS